MTFLVPLGLIALIALPIILWLHLLRERRPRAVVPSLLLWQNLPRRPEGRKRRRLPLTLLLLLHLLVASLLGLALGQPQWLGNLLGWGGHTVLIVDTSMSMETRESALGETRIDQARAEARRIINDLSGQDSLTLISAGPEAAVLMTGNANSRANMLASVDTLTPGGVGSDVAGALTLAQAALEGERSGNILVVSDGALPPTLSETTQELQLQQASLDWRTVGSPRDNRAIVVFAARPRGNITSDRATISVYVRIANYGSTTLTTDMRLFGDDELLDTRSVNLQPDGEVELTWTTPPGVSVLRAEIDGQDDLPVDDVAYLSLEQIRPINTLVVSESPELIERVLNAVPGPNVEVVDPATYPTAPIADEADLTIFDGTLPTEWPIGGVLVINPPLGDNPLLAVQETRPISEVMELVTSQSPAANNLLEGLSLNSVNFGSVQIVQAPDWATAQLATNDAPLILRGDVGQSNIAIWTFDLAQGNLSERLAFPLLMARTVRDLTPMPLPMAIYAGEPLTLHPDLRTETVEVLGPDEEAQPVTVTAPFQLAGLTRPGLYTIVERTGEDTVYNGQIAVNAGSPLESDVRPRLDSQDSIAASDSADAPDTGDPLSREQEPVWPWLAMFALVFMVIEWVYIHR